MIAKLEKQDFHLHSYKIADRTAERLATSKLAEMHYDHVSFDIHIFKR